MKALVTGSAGFIGGHLVRELEAQGWEVHGADLKEGLDLSWPDELQGLPDVDTVFHLAAFTGVRASVRFPLRCQLYNVIGTQNVLEWCLERGVRRLVFASSSSVYGDGSTPFREDQDLQPMSPYAASKAACEQLCYAYYRLHDMQIAVLRYFTVYGPNGRPDMAVRRFLEAMRAGQPIAINGDGTQLRDFTYVGDVVRATIAAAGWQGWNVVNVGRGWPESVRNLALMLGQILDCNPQIEHGPANRADVPVTWADTMSLRLRMNWEPVPLAEGLRLTAGR